MAQRIEAHAELETRRNEDNKLVQELVLVDDNGKYSREFYLTVEQAQDVLQNFVFENNKTYIVSTLTPYGWKSTRAFNYYDGFDVVSKVYNQDHEAEYYDDVERLDNNALHVFSIVVEEL